MVGGLSQGRCWLFEIVMLRQRQSLLQLVMGLSRVCGYVQEASMSRYNGEEE
jgi:hypothetical protein